MMSLGLARSGSHQVTCDIIGSWGEYKPHGQWYLISHQPTFPCLPQLTNHLLQGLPLLGDLTFQPPLLLSHLGMVLVVGLVGGLPTPTPSLPHLPQKWGVKMIERSWIGICVVRFLLEPGKLFMEGGILLLALILRTYRIIQDDLDTK